MADTRFNILSLCSGVGMLDEGVCLAVPGARTVCYVERESGAAALLLARMGDKALEPAPVWCGNLEDLDVGPWALAVDCLTAGFPCQPHSQAGARKSTEDERWIWPAIADIIRRILAARDAAGEVRPFYVFLENVRGLLTSGDGGALAQVLADLALMGFDAEWGLLSAASVGATHQRERIFILGCRSLDSSSERGCLDGRSGQHPADAGLEAFGESEPGSGSVADAGCEHEHPQQWAHGAELERAGRILAEPIQHGLGASGIPDGEHDGCELGADCQELGDTECSRWKTPRNRQQEHSGRESESGRRGMADTSSRRWTESADDICRRQSISRNGSKPVFAPGPSADWRDIQAHLYPAIEPGLCIMADGLALVVDASRADQLRAIGNGVVPLQAAVAFRVLNRRLTRGI